MEFPAFTIHRRTVSYTKPNPSDILFKLDAEPYLTWVPEAQRRLTIDPSVLPAYHGRSLRILMMSSSYLTGGAEMMAVNTVRVLAGCQSVFLWSQRPGPFNITKGLTVHEGDPVRLARDLRVDVVVYNNGAAFWYSERFKKELPHVKQVMCLHGLVQWTVDQFHGNEALINNIDAFWAFSRVAGAMRVFGFKAPAYELHCPIDASVFPFESRTWRAPYQIGYIGRVSPEKNLVGLLQLWGHLYKALKGQCVFHFIGGLDPTNHDKNYLEWLTPVYNAMKNTPEWRTLMDAGVLIDHGQSTPTQVRRLVSKLHVLTLTSDFEGEPVVFTEAMSSGCLCSYRDVGEVGQQLRDSGLLTTATARRITDSEMQDMVRGIACVLKDPAECQRLVRAGRAKVDTRHANQAWADNFCRMLGDILK